MIKREKYKPYEKLFSRYGITMPHMLDMESEVEAGKYSITEIVEYFHKTPSGNWQKKPYERKESKIPVEYYLNGISSIPLFDDRVTRKETKFGRIPYQLSCVSWGTGDTMAKRTYIFVNEN